MEIEDINKQIFLVEKELKPLESKRSKLYEFKN